MRVSLRFAAVASLAWVGWSLIEDRILMEEALHAGHLRCLEVSAKTNTLLRDLDCSQFYETPQYSLVYRAGLAAFIYTVVVPLSYLDGDYDQLNWPKIQKETRLF